MNKTTSKLIKLTFFAFTLICVSGLSTTFVLGVIDYDQPNTVQNGYTDAFTHSVNNYKNQRFQITPFFNQTVNPTYELHVFCVRRTTWDLMLDGSLAVENITDVSNDNILYYHLLEHSEIYTADVVIPDWEDWTFVFLNLNGADMLTQIRIEHQHILWWLWIVIPVLVVLGLATYGIMENVTKYQRARMDSQKAISKIGSRKESERKRAAYWLISNGTHDDLAELSELMESENAIVRENVAFVLGGLSKTLEDYSYAKVLLAKYEIETDTITKESIVGALCDIGDISALKIYEKYLHIDHNEKLRFKVAETLADIASEKTAKTLVRVLNEPNTDTLKIVARRALENIANKAKTNVDSLIKQYSE